MHTASKNTPPSHLTSGDQLGFQMITSPTQRTTELTKDEVTALDRVMSEGSQKGTLSILDSDDQVFAVSADTAHYVFHLAKDEEWMDALEHLFDFGKDEHMLAVQAALRRVSPQTVKTWSKLSTPTRQTWMITVLRNFSEFARYCETRQFSLQI